MGDREKLIELQEKWFSCDDCADLEKFAEFLIANGVVVQQWVSVKDRLPEESGKYLTRTARGGYLLLPYSAKHKLFNVMDNFVCYENAIECTHWMPLPAPPEGE